MKYKIEIEFDDFSALIADIIGKLVLGFGELTVHEAIDQAKNSETPVIAMGLNKKWKLMKN